MNTTIFFFLVYICFLFFNFCVAALTTTSRLTVATGKKELKKKYDNNIIYLFAQEILLLSFVCIYLSLIYYSSCDNPTVILVCVRLSFVCADQITLTRTETHTNTNTIVVVVFLEKKLMKNT